MNEQQDVTEALKGVAAQAKGFEQQMWAMIQTLDHVSAEVILALADGGRESMFSQAIAASDALQDASEAVLRFAEKIHQRERQIIGAATAAAQDQSTN